MNRAKKIKLISEEFEPDSIGQMVPTEKEHEIWATVRDVSATESERPVEGLRPSKVFDVLVTEYSDEENVEYKGVRYRIYRTYLRDDSKVELYGGVRVGQ